MNLVSNVDSDIRTYYCMIKCLIYGEDISRFRYVKLKAKRQKHKMTAPVFYANINQN